MKDRRQAEIQAVTCAGELGADTSDWVRGVSLRKGPWTEVELVYLDTISFFEKWSMENH